jgi:hypothetical protein
MNNNKTNNKAKCRPGGTLRVFAGKNMWNFAAQVFFTYALVNQVKIIQIDSNIYKCELGGARTGARTRSIKLA